MHKFIYIFLCFASACTVPDEKQSDSEKNADYTTITVTDSNDAAKNKVAIPIIPPTKKIKNPSGIYRSSTAFNPNMEQTVAFYNDNTYRLQEKYNSGKKDSIVVTVGNWSPSDGYIWLYKDQLVRGRYSWKGDTLQYFSPASKKNFAMHSLTDVMENNLWKNKKQEGIVFFGIGNEPFWSVEVNNKDSLSFQLSEWTQPLSVKVTTISNQTDSVIYEMQNDTLQLRLTILPFFCNDGMSDIVYKNKMRLVYNNQSFTGCGVLYR